jgi:hypothetical protein
MLVLPQDQRFYACEIFAHMQKIKRKHPTTIFLDFLKKIIKLNNLFFKKLSPHFDSDFSMVAFKNLVFILFRSSKSLWLFNATSFLGR